MPTPSATLSDQSQPISEPPSVERILAAAKVEFSAHGYKGARIDRIAKLAHANRQLIYRHYGNKENLYKTVLLSMVAEARERFGDFFPAFSVDDSESSAESWARMMAWEGLTSGTAAPAVAQDARRESLRAQVENVRRAQATGELDASLDPELVVIFTVGLSVLPWIVPHIVELITGHNPAQDPEMRARIRAFGESLIRS